MLTEKSEVHPPASVIVTIASPAQRALGLKTDSPLDHTKVNGA